jgi:biotin carboxyl carrier protein
MKFQFDIGDRQRTVDIRRHGDGFVVTIDGMARRVDAVRLNGDSWSLIVDDANGTPASIEAAVVPRNGTGTMQVYVDGHRIDVAVRGEPGRRSRGDAVASGSGPQRLAAPMPGKVVKLLVKAGDDVQPRQGLVVIEAMKLENELRASRAGRVRDVFVSEGQSVEAGAALVVVE